jgi:hypothetical protein
MNINVKAAVSLSRDVFSLTLSQTPSALEKKNYKKIKKLCGSAYEN